MTPARMEIARRSLSAMVKQPVAKILVGIAFVYGWVLRQIEFLIAAGQGVQLKGLGPAAVVSQGSVNGPLPHELRRWLNAGDVSDIVKEPQDVSGWATRWKSVTVRNDRKRAGGRRGTVPEPSSRRAGR
jgi:hypothetical protein